MQSIKRVLSKSLVKPSSDTMLKYLTQNKFAMSEETAHKVLKVIISECVTNS